MRKSRFSDEQIIAILREQEAGRATAEVCRKHGISDATFYKWKSKYGGLQVSETLGECPRSPLDEFVSIGSDHNGQMTNALLQTSSA